MNTTPSTEEKTETAHPTLIMVRGIPGSGKSYVVAKLQESIGKDNVVILDPDATDHSSKEYTELSSTLTAEGVDAKLHPYRFLRTNAYKAVDAHKIIIWNQAFIDLDGFGKTVNNLSAYALDHGTKLPTLVVEVEINSDIAKQRVAKRAAEGGHDVPEEAFDRFIDRYESFATKGYTTVTVNGEDDVATSVSSILRALEKL
jgi:thymidylate kinase